MSKLFHNDPWTSHFIGFDALFKDLDSLLQGQIVKADSFPPHNIMDYGDAQHAIEMAVAGYKKEDLTVTFDGVDLIISGDQTPRVGVYDSVYFEKVFKQSNISRRKFRQKFTLAKNIEIQNITLEDGILRIDLKEYEPQTSSVKTLDINVK